MHLSEKMGSKQEQAPAQLLKKLNRGLNIAR